MSLDLQSGAQLIKVAAERASTYDAERMKEWVKEIQAATDVFGGPIAQRLQAYQMHDLPTHVRYPWHGTYNYLELNPEFASAHIFRGRHQIRAERDFDYFI